jgi:hypothetical protein
VTPLIGDTTSCNQIDFGCLDGRLAGGKVGSGLPLRGDRVIVVLLADRVSGNENLVALR